MGANGNASCRSASCPWSGDSILTDFEAIHLRRAVQRTAFCTRRLRASVDSGCGLMHRTRPSPYSPTITAGVLIMVPSCGLYLDTSLRKCARERKLPSPCLPIGDMKAHFGSELQKHPQNRRGLSGLHQLIPSSPAPSHLETTCSCGRSRVHQWFHRRFYGC